MSSARGGALEDGPAAGGATGAQIKSRPRAFRPRGAGPLFCDRLSARPANGLDGYMAALARLGAALLTQSSRHFLILAPGAAHFMDWRRAGARLARVGVPGRARARGRAPPPIKAAPFRCRAPQRLALWLTIIIGPSDFAAQSSGFTLWGRARAQLAPGRLVRARCAPGAHQPAAGGRRAPGARQRDKSAPFIAW